MFVDRLFNILLDKASKRLTQLPLGGCCQYCGEQHL